MYGISIEAMNELITSLGGALAGLDTALSVGLYTFLLVLFAALGTDFFTSYVEWLDEDEEEVEEDLEEEELIECEEEEEEQVIQVAVNRYEIQEWVPVVATEEEEAHLASCHEDEWLIAEGLADACAFHILHNPGFDHIGRIQEMLADMGREDLAQELFEYEEHMVEARTEWERQIEEEVAFEEYGSYAWLAVA